MSAPIFQQIDDSYVYELPVPGGRGWAGYLLPEGTKAPPKSIALADAFNTVEGHYLFSAARPTTLNNPHAFAKTVFSTFAKLQNPSFYGRAIAWLTLTKKGALDTISSCIQFSYKPLSGWGVHNNDNISLGDKLSFFIGSGTQLNWDDKQESITATSATGVTIGFTTSFHDDSGLKLAHEDNGYSVFLQLNGNYRGCLTMTVTLALSNALDFFEVGLQYLHVTSNVPARFSYLLFRYSTDTRNMAGVLDPLDPLNMGITKDEKDNGFFRTGFVFIDSDPLPSFLNTTSGRQISLSPLGGTGGLANNAGGLVFTKALPDTRAESPANDYQLAPIGDYGLLVDGVAAATAGQQMLPGLFGSEYLTFTTMNTTSASDILRWTPNKPAYAPVYPFDASSLENPASGAIIDKLDTTYLTSWGTILAGGVETITYSAQPAGAALYSATKASNQILYSDPPSSPLPTSDGFAFPLVPYGGLAATVNGDDAGKFESQILSPTRKTTIMHPGTQDREAERTSMLTSAAPPTSKTATTPQGLLAEIAIGSNRYLKLTLAKPADAAKPDFAFTNLSVTLQDAFQTNQLFVVMVNNKPLNTDQAGFLNMIDISDWTFIANVGDGSLLTSYRNVMILKFCDGTLKERVENPNKWTMPEAFSVLPSASEGTAALALGGLSSWLQAYISDALKSPDKTLFSDFNRIVSDPDWNGFVVLNADLPVTSLPEQIRGIGTGIDLSHFTAHHFGSEVSRIKAAPDGTLTIDGVSSLFGLIDYVDPLYKANIASGGGTNSPIPLTTNSGYAFSVLKLQVLFAQAKLKSFSSRIQLSLDNLFDAPILSSQFNGHGQTISAMVLDGSAVQQNGQTTYVFVQTAPYVFTPDCGALNAIAINRVQFNTLGTDSNGNVTSRFLFWGAFDFTTLKDTNGAFDLMSFGSNGKDDLGNGLAFSNLQIAMQFAETTPSVVRFAFEPDHIAFDMGASTIRKGSLFKKFALQVTGFIAAPANKTPQKYNFLPIVMDGVQVQKMSGPWFGIRYKLDMGTPGALASAAGFTSSFVTAWSPAAKRNAPQQQVYAGLTLPGAAPGASALSLQGVIKLSTGSLTLQHAQDSFTLRIENIGISILGIAKLPSNATINFFLFGDPKGDGSLAWYAAYQASGQQSRLAVLEEGS
jgi:hypothetical protein